MLMRKSFREKILLVMAVMMAVIGGGIYGLAKVQTARLTERYQRELFNERIDTICATLFQDYEKLIGTGLEDAYRSQFQDKALHHFSETYHDHEIYPIILNREGVDLLQLREGEIDDQLIERMVGKEGVQFEFFTPPPDSLWVIGRQFEPWDWAIIYVIPDHYKTAQSDALSRQLAVIIVFVFLGSFLIIYLIISRLTLPLSALSKASIEMAQGNLNCELPESDAGEVGQLIRSFGLMRDSIHSQLKKLEREVDERRQAEERTRQKESDLRITLNSIGDAVITTDAEGCITRMNPVAEKLTDWRLEEALGRKLPEVLNLFDEYNSDQPYPNPVEQVFKHNIIIGLSDNTMLEARDGQRYRVADSAAPIRDADQDIVGVVIVFRDITREYVLQEQLQHSQKMDAIGQLAGGVAHDFNNVLGGILGAADLLMTMAEKKEQKDLLEMIIRTVKRAGDLTQKLLTFGRKGRLQSTPINVHTAVSTAIDLLKGSLDKRVKLEVALEASSSVVIGDVSLLQNAILNLSINAAHAMPDGGTLSVKTDTVYLDAVYCEVSSFKLTPGPFIEISIKDTGVGIEPAHLAKIFEPFFTTKEQGKGTGLGLAAVYGTVQQHHGAITVYSEVGKGTVFNIYIPLEEVEKEVVEEVEVAVSGSGCVLVIDDEEIIRITAKAMLTQLGYEVLLAENGVQGVAEYSKNRGRIDVVILDMVMPEMDGRDCFRKLQEMNPDVRVVLTSGFSIREDVDEMLQHGLLDVIRKPYSSSEISRVLAEVLGQRTI